MGTGLSPDGRSWVCESPFAASPVGIIPQPGRAISGEGPEPGWHGLDDEINFPYSRDNLMIFQGVTALLRQQEIDSV
jgi:hypothetical protein